MENGELTLSVFAGLPLALPAARKELLHEKDSGQQRWLQPVLLVTRCSLWSRHSVYPPWSQGECGISPRSFSSSLALSLQNF